MSIGNTKDQGNKGNNFPFQLKTLQLLNEINNSINALPGVDYETRTTTYQAIANGIGYSIGDVIVRYDIINIATGTISSTIWFNQTTQLQITPAPLSSDINQIPGSNSVTVINGPAANAVNIQDGGNSITVDQSGTWDINNISGTISLPTGASTEVTALSSLTQLQNVNTALAGLSLEATQLLVKTVLDNIKLDTANLNISLSDVVSQITLLAASEITLTAVQNNVTSKINRIKGAANYNRAFSYYGSTNNVSSIVHTGVTLEGSESITELFTYVDNNVDGSKVTNIQYT